MRIKRMESVEDKFRRHPDKYGTDWDAARFRTMDDALGVRVIVYFLSDFTLVHNELHSLADDIEVLGDPPTTAYLPAGLPERLNLGLVDRKDKTSGYASLHYRCRLRRSEVPLEQRPLFEIQVRTLAEHTWAEIHHLIGYKREKETSVEVEEETRIISSHLKVIDEHFDLLSLDPPFWSGCGVLCGGRGRWGRRLSRGAALSLSVVLVDGVAIGAERDRGQAEAGGVVSMVISMTGVVRRVAGARAAVRVRRESRWPRANGRASSASLCARYVSGVRGSSAGVL
jgi:ppGpp synthetase/RelA/SpoT-type nucleotidyltranferase